MYEAWTSIPCMSRKDYLDSKTFSEKICRNFSISKADAFDLLKIFEEFGYVSLIKFGKN
jgi:hypothetical protein